ncbi:MAG: hypothetical protein UHS41_05695 [Lachnospiraceae bacterium]|nr:hypothetical protein [Lachnospiraceae bacterium]
MPGYIMHMAEANLILKKMEQEKKGKWKKAFIAGNLLPDTKQKMEKVTSHFWDPNTLDQMAIIPDLSRFLKKYGHMLEHPVVLGYYAHLYLDEQFVTRYWPDMVTFYDDNGVVQTKKKDITKVRIGKSGEWVSREKFFSGEYYYGDYSRLNNYFIDKYNIRLDVDYTQQAWCPIKEVKPKELTKVMGELKRIMTTCDREKENEILVFSKKRLCKFLEDVSEEFVEMISERE